MTLRRTLQRSLSTTTRGLLQFGSGGVAPSYDTDAQTYITAVEAADGESLETGVKDAINAFVVGCKSDGIWAAIKASCILAGARTLTGALVPLVGTAPTNNNFVSGDYNRKTGLVGDGVTKYLDSNRAGNADPQDDVHYCVYQVSSPTQGGPLPASSAFPVAIGAGTGSTTGSRAFGVNNTGDDGVCRNTSATSDAITGIRTSIGFIGSSRSSSSEYLFRLNSTTLPAFSRVSETPVSVNFGVFRGLGGTASNSVYFNGRLSFYSIGEALDLALLDSRVSTLMTAIGAAIP